MTSPEELLAATCGSLVAPAGCGKTELIAKAVKKSSPLERQLILTHTNAGVGALRARLRSMRVAQDRYQVDTIAGFCLRYSAAYPNLSGLGDAVNPRGRSWETVYPAATQLISSAFGGSIVAASYSGVLVDEYQDCSPEQHQLVVLLSRLLPVRVLGDPMQSIFGFRGPSVTWDLVEESFPPLAPLATPWRWTSTNPALGDWLIEARQVLQNGNSFQVDDSVPLERLSAESAPDHMRLLASKSESVVALRKWESDTHLVAGAFDGLYNAIETVDCADLSSLGHSLDNSPRRRAIIDLLDLFRRSSVGLNPYLSEGINRLEARSRLGFDDWEEMYGPLKDYVNTGSPGAIGVAVDALLAHADVRPFRSELLEAVRNSARAVASGECVSFGEAAWVVRDQTRRVGRAPERRIVSRTLLVKGLEFDHAVVLNPSELSINELYVAMTRGSKSLAVVTDAAGLVEFDSS